VLKILYFDMFDWFVSFGHLVLNGLVCATVLYSSLQGIEG